MRGLVFLVVVVAVAGLAIFLVTNNTQLVTLHLPFLELTDLALWSVLLGSFGIGAALVGIGLSWPSLRLRLRVRTQARQITRLEQEVHGLRTLPLPDEESGAPEG